MVNWDSLVSILIIIFLVLIVWARVSNQTIIEVIKDIKEMITDSKDEAEEVVEGVTFYE